MFSKKKTLVGKFIYKLTMKVFLFDKMFVALQHLKCMCGITK